jgi:hypothetical protein
MVPFIADQDPFRSPTPARGQVTEILQWLFQDALKARHDTRYEDYQPQDTPVPARYAAYTANLVTLIILASQHSSASALFPASHNPAGDWRKLTLLWRSQLDTDGWLGLLDTIATERIWLAGQRDITIRRTLPDECRPSEMDFFWIRNLSPDDEYRPSEPGNWSVFSGEPPQTELFTRAYFTADPADDACLHALRPLASELSTTINTFHAAWQQPPVSAAHALISLWLASSLETSPTRLTAAYDTCLRICDFGFSPDDKHTRELFRTIVLRQLQSDQRKLPESWLLAAAETIKNAETRNRKNGADFVKLAHQILPDLMSRQHTKQTNPR